MNNYLLIAVIVITGAVIFFLKSAKKKDTDSYPYESRIRLVTPAERSFLGVLEQAAGDGFRVFSKIRLTDILKVKSGLPGSARQSAFNRISSRHTDFVICNKNDLSFVAVVELDDKSHKADKQKEKDQFLNAALSSAGIRIIRFPAKAQYNIDEVRDKIKGAAPTASLSVPAENYSAPESNNLCPKCGSEPVKKTAKKGAYAGSLFWGCSGYPDCRYTMKEGK